MKKIAILISGQMRTAKECFKNIKETLPEGDYYIHAVLDENSSDAEYFDPVRLLIEHQNEMPEKREYSWQIGRGCHGVQRVLKQLHSLKRTWSLFKKHHTNYDWIIRCRSDLLFTKGLEDINTWRGDIIIPKFCNWFGLNDRFAIISPPYAEKYFCRIDCLDNYIEKGGVFHPESFLYSCFQSNQISRTDVQFYTLREDKTKDSPVYDIKYGDII
jgi:hypothetical protein